MNAAQIEPIPQLTGEFHNWRSAAACADYDPDMFFDHAEGDPAVAAIAKDVCETCIIREQCLHAAMLANEEYGIWGGLDARERAIYRPSWERVNGGRGHVRVMREQNGIVTQDPSIERRYSARLKAARACRQLVLQAGPFHRRDEFLAVLELIIAHPREDSGTLGRRVGFSKAWFNTMKREVYRRFGIKENYESDEEKIA